MLTKTEKSFSLIFAIIVIAELICGNIDSLSAFHYITKPLILIALIIFFWKEGKHLKTQTKLITFLALIFSLFGDILLMFVNQSANFFIAGLLSFLLAHIMYILVFLKKKNNSNSALPFIGISLIYAAGLFYFLLNGLGDLLIPVIIYMLVILLMATT